MTWHIFSSFLGFSRFLISTNDTVKNSILFYEAPNAELQSSKFEDIFNNKYFFTYGAGRIALYGKKKNMH